jgi:AraC-like DNA-binding protein
MGAALRRRERLAFATFPELPDVEFLSGWFVEEPFDPHMHESFTIGVMLAGSERFLCGSTEYLAPAGSIAVLNPGVIHRGGPGPEGWWTYRMVYPSQALIDGLARELWGPQVGSIWFPEVLVHDPELAQSLAALQEDLGETDSLERGTALYCVLTTLLVRHAKVSGAPRPVGQERSAVARARRHLEENFASSVTLDELGRVARLSPCHLLRVFHGEIGLPPHAYLRQLRVNRAKELLSRGVATAEVATAAGFADQSHLTRPFKRIVGITPAAYGRAITFKT